MKLDITYQKYKLKFKFVAGTSRGKFSERDSYLIFLKDKTKGITGIGEASPLKGLSLDFVPDFARQLESLFPVFSYLPDFKDTEEVLDFVEEKVPSTLPSIRFAFETALLDLLNGGNFVIFPNDFTEKQKPLPINGLIWMGEEAFMTRQIDQKIASGFNCIKMKIGSIDFDTELQILGRIRSQYDSGQITLRVDANGAFDLTSVRDRLLRLAALDIHSIEQPIKAGHPDDMAQLCREHILPIALDEELIGNNDATDKLGLLQLVNPQFIILKPTLLGGIRNTMQWISMAGKLGIGWWITSALESNIGLNAICQFTAQYNINLPQGLGTGQLYKNNIMSPLVMNRGEIRYDHTNVWDLSTIH